MPADPKLVRDLFLAAAELPVDDRPAYLQQTASDPELLAAVERLLAAHDDPASLLPRSANGVPTAEYTPIAERVGSTIGHYKLMEQIGEGGFGLVFVAEQQEPVKRKVALKVIKPGMDSRQVIARFQAERQALALMDHPNIARVFDAGATDSGRPYFVMELVRGVPITEYCDKNQLTPKDRLELFVTVCQAIQHAHQKGIIHRDIKPSNVLVTSHDGKPVAKVIDFGVAKAIHQQLSDRTVYTQFAQMIGTPLYMSPEQAEMSGLDIDTRSDIYSLGVLLYELLTGTTPIDKKRFAKAAYDEIRRLIREEEPPKPSTRLSTTESIASVAAQRHTEPAKLSKLVRGDLDWVTMRCLEKDRTRRYETANGLARDIQRFLDDEPVEACPPSATYRLRKFARKNRAALTVAAAIAVLLLGGIAFSSWQAYRARCAEGLALSARNAEAEQRRKAEAATDAEKTARERAERAEADAKRDLAKFEAINEFLINDLLTQAEPANNAVEDKVTLLDVLDRAADAVDERFRDQPELEQELRRTIAKTYHGLASWEKAERQWREVRDNATRRLGAESTEALYASAELGHVLFHEGKIGDAIPLLESAVRGLKAKPGPDHLVTIASMYSLGVLYQAAGKLNLALPLLEESLRLSEATHGAHHPATTTSLSLLAVAYQEAGKLDLAMPLFEESLKRDKAKWGADHPETLASMIHLASGYLDSGKIELALPLFEETMKLSKARLGVDHQCTLASMDGLALCYLANYKLDVAFPLLEEALKLNTAKLGATHPNTLTSMHNLAHAHFSLRQFDKSIPLFERCLKLREEKLGRNHPNTQATIASLGENYKDAGRLDQALPLLEEAYRHAPLRVDVTPLLDAYVKAGKTEQAVRIIDELIVASRNQLPTDTPQLAGSLAKISSSLLQLNAFAKAEPLLRESLAIREKHEPEDWRTFNTQSMLGGALLGQARAASEGGMPEDVARASSLYKDAEPLLLKGYEGMKARKDKIPEQGRMRIPEALDRLIELYTATNKPDEADRWRKTKDARNRSEANPKE